MVVVAGPLYPPRPMVSVWEILERRVVRKKMIAGWTGLSPKVCCFGALNLVDGKKRLLSAGKNLMLVVAMWLLLVDRKRNQFYC